MVCKWFEKNILSYRKTLLKVLCPRLRWRQADQSQEDYVHEAECHGAGLRNSLTMQITSASGGEIVFLMSEFVEFCSKSRDSDGTEWIEAKACGLKSHVFGRLRALLVGYIICIIPGWVHFLNLHFLCVYTTRKNMSTLKRKISLTQ